MSMAQSYRQIIPQLARHLGISGPIIAENAGVAKQKAHSELMDLGYSRQPAITALEELKVSYTVSSTAPTSLA